MKIRTFLLFLLLTLLPVICRAQTLNSKILMVVDGKNVQAGEFIRMYNKSREPGKAQDVNSYLGQFTIFKLKVADALHEGYDTTRSFRNELAGYRNQLAQNYLTDGDVKEKLLQKAYQRSLTDINAWHILIGLSAEALPDDTLRAWKKAIDVRERIIKGEPFESVARGTSDDKSVKINGGNLGYFTAFQMIMPFEDAAYSLKKGTLSMPVRTPFGYHIILVADKRPSKGRIKVAHIMKAVQPGSDENDSDQAKASIDSIYQLLKNGASFSDLARKYSDHKQSAVRGGELDWFGTGEIVSDFSEAAFSLTDTGKFTQPVRTPYGWHIIKLLGKKAPGTFEESRSWLESRINQSYLNSISKKSFTERLKREYKFQLNNEAYNWFVSHTDTLIIKGLKTYDPAALPAGNIYSFASQSVPVKDFADYVNKKATMVITRDSSVFIKKMIELKAYDDLSRYENSVLETKYPDFRYLMQEFHDGMLLFEISGKRVWNRVGSDTSGLKNYYDGHKENWLSKKGIEARIYTLKVPGGQNQLSSAFSRLSKKPDLDVQLNRMFNKPGDTLLIIREGKWFAGENKKLDSIEWTPGQHEYVENEYPSIVMITKVIEPSPVRFEEVKGEVMTGFQDLLEKAWTGQLIKKYNVKTDSSVLEEVRKELRNE